MIQAAKIIGTGLARTGLIGAGIGIGVVFGGLILGVARNPSLRGQLFSYALIRFAFSEATRLFALMMAFFSLPSMYVTIFLFNNYVVMYNYFYTLYNRIKFECIVYKLKMLFIYYLDNFYSKHKVMVYLLMLHSIGIIFNVIINPDVIHCCLFGLLVLSIGLLTYLVFFDTVISLNYPKTYIILCMLCLLLLIIPFAYLSYTLLIGLVKYIVNITTRPKPRVNYSENMSDDSSSKGGSNRGGPNGGGDNNDSGYVHDTKKKNNKENKRKYNNSEKGKATNRAWHNSEKGQASNKKYMQSDKRKENRREWGQTEKGEQSIKNSRSNYSNSGKREQTRKIWERTETGKKSTKASSSRYYDKRKVRKIAGKALVDAVDNV